jgi:hypothetical protein
MIEHTRPVALFTRARIAASHWTTGVCLAFVLLLSAGCGYVSSGTWDDDPANWKKAFKSQKPDDVVVVHSQYWRTAHWSYEAGYMFEIASNARLREQFFKENRLSRMVGPAAAEAKEMCFRKCPSWFAPKAVEAYEVWGYSDEPKGNFRVLIDRTTGTMFLADFQV